MSIYLHIRCLRDSNWAGPCVAPALLSSLLYLPMFPIQFKINKRTIVKISPQPHVRKCLWITCKCRKCILAWNYVSPITAVWFLNGLGVITDSLQLVPLNQHSLKKKIRVSLNCNLMKASLILAFVSLPIGRVMMTVIHYTIAQYIHMCNAHIYTAHYCYTYYTNIQYSI